MTDLRKAAEMALEALEDYRFASGFERPLAQDAIDELRQALAQPESTKWEPAISHNYNPDGTLRIIKVKLTPQSGWVDYEPLKRESVDAVNMSQERVDETAKREHEPYGYLWFTHQMERRFTHYRPKEEQRIGEVTPIYTAPPKREWVGLTDEDKQEAFDETQEASGGFWEFADYLEARLKEKNA